MWPPEHIVVDKTHADSVRWHEGNVASEGLGMYDFGGGNSQQ